MTSLLITLNDVILLDIGRNFNMDLQRDPDTMIEFVPRAGDFHATVDNVVMKSGSTMFSMLTHLLERGVYSGEPFMMESVNHRDADSHFWLNKTEGRDYSMIQSLTENKQVQRFDVGGEKVSLCFYRVVDNAERGVRLRTPREVAVADGSVSGYIYAEGYRANVIDGAAFRRLLAIFNLRWTVERDRPPTVDELVSFCEIFNGFDFASVDGWNRFIEHYSLGGFFSIVDEWSINDIHYYFGITLRSLTNVRIDAFDGQHRFLLSGMFLVGHFAVSPNVPHPRSSWADSGYASKFEIGKTQLFTRLGFNVGVLMTDALVPIPDDQPPGDNEYDHDLYRRTLQTRITIVRNAMKSVGGKLTEAQQLSIEPTWPEFIQKVFQDKAMQECVDYTFQNFWLKKARQAKATSNSSTAFTTNIANLQATLARHLSLNSQSRYKKLVLSKGSKEIDKCLQEISTSLENMRSIPANRVSADATVMLELVRSFMHSETSQNHFRRLLTPDGCGFNWCQRSKELREHNSRFRDVNWLKDNIVVPVRTVIDHIKKRINVERYIITTLRSVTEDNEDGPYHRFINNEFSGPATGPESVAHLFGDIPNEKEITKLNEVNLRSKLFHRDAKYAGSNSTSQCNGLMNMIEFACYVQLTEDIAMACVELGFDPDFAVCPTYNHSLSDTEKRLSARIAEQRSNSYKAVVEQFTENGEYKPASTKSENEYIFHRRFRRAPKAATIPTEDDEENEDDTDDDHKFNKRVRYHIYYDVDRHIQGQLNEEEGVYYACTKSNQLLREYLT